MMFLRGGLMSVGKNVENFPKGVIDSFKNDSFWKKNATYIRLK